MDPQDLNDMADDPRFIAGIYNYCDRWCERCPFTSRCLNYAMSAEISGDLGANDLNNRRFWNDIRKILENTEKMLSEMAAEADIDLDDPEIQADEEARKLRKEEAERHHLVISARLYAGLVDRWFNENGAPERDDEDRKRVDAVEIIRWHQHQILVKLMRALDMEDPDDEIEKSDSDGSAKVALIGIDRSIAAWGILLDRMPDLKESTTTILFRLESLRKAAEAQFPNARRFRRPGFDTEHLPDDDGGGTSRPTS